MRKEKTTLSQIGIYVWALSWLEPPLFSSTGDSDERAQKLSVAYSMTRMEMFSYQKIDR